MNRLMIAALGTLALIACGQMDTPKSSPASAVTEAKTEKNGVSQTQAAAAATAVEKRSAADKTTKTADAEPRRIVSLGAGVTETVFALGLGDRIAGVDVSSLHPPEALRKPKVGYVRKTSAEGIASLKPDLVIASSTLGPEAIHSQLKTAGIRLELVNEPKSIDAALGRIQEIGDLLNRSKPAAELVSSIRGKIKTAAEQAHSKDPVRVLFVFVHGGAAMQIAGKSTTADLMITAAGGVNAVSEYEGYKALSPEALLAAKPDVILATTRSLKAVGGADGLWSSPGLSTTPAGKEKKVLVMDDLLILGFGPRFGDALVELSQFLYP